jgi:hypothetical protein
MSISNDEDKLSHNKVMEALKAKIQRGGGPMSPLGPPTPRDPLEKKKKFSAPTPTETTASPRSAKPYLPPIDTNMGRIDTNHEKSDSSSSSSESEEENKAKHVGSPSDPILVNARRARSLSPSSAKKS